MLIIRISVDDCSYTLSRLGRMSSSRIVKPSNKLYLLNFPSRMQCFSNTFIYRRAKTVTMAKHLVYMCKKIEGEEEREKVQEIENSRQHRHQHQKTIMPNFCYIEMCKRVTEIRKQLIWWSWRDVAFGDTLFSRFSSFYFSICIFFLFSNFVFFDFFYAPPTKLNSIQNETALVIRTSINRRKEK